MAKQSFPVKFLAEFRGTSPGGSFTRDETGELVQYGPQLKLEREDLDGELVQYQLRVGEKVDVDFDVESLKKGEPVELAGEVVISDRGGYFRLHQLRRPGKAAAGNGAGSRDRVQQPA